ncbi:non-hydrolyzing UDP-N-acetylglucosamine 2-epimerase [Methylobacterium isbiliense]|uniref:UDP-N-acetylglucosamine 2-epimerase (non-hydrolyzing) n=1 Tax=Methylobacterium isbiliense TaxID=315478 RepID=A0ABQ4S8Y3_9HYPH|nr:UDP-N-acetylglucosamine 2-epimerase (non-hydrolyzing) [Methylobacterium isbiliense]MDN3623183.1 UDP-N-acetylglucosamine 2-epimerase (non-hydrolyzing) [Methylobacterium isbiliense]GJD98253.1 UDP-N-acetylglucosamine 2-epimerase [Methylobacterium isbiliense]
MKILSVFGTRPEAIKMAPVVAALQATPGVTSRVCVTGQHRSMLDSVLSTFALSPDDDLDVMRPDQTLADVSARVMTGLDRILAAWRPDCVLVQGDTATSTAAAMAAFFRRVPVGHVEAGLRTGNIASPWPEEANRRLTAVVADRHYAPTARARDALLAEGHAPDRILVTGNTGIDALLRMAEIVGTPGPLKAALEERYAWIDPAARLILVTGHRRESFGDGFERICVALKALARLPGVQVVYPVHLNPNVREPVFRHLGSEPGIRLIEPLDYPDFVYLMTRASVILTDSGGVQEEAPVLRKPVLVMRDTSERAEAIEAGVARLVGTDPEVIVGAIRHLLSDADAYAAMASGASPFGDGHASTRIVADLLGRSAIALPPRRRRPAVAREFVPAPRPAAGAQRIA